MNVRRFQPEDIPRIARLNDRLTRAGVRWPVYGEGPRDQREGPVSSRLFVAEDGDEIRGAVWLREHDFRLGGETQRLGWAKYPVAESLINPAFSGVPGALLIRLQREQPRLMALGLGGQGGAFARLLAGLRWTGASVPFFVLPLRPTRVMRHLRQLRRTAARRAALDVLALSGLGWLGWQAIALARRAVAPRVPRGDTVTVVDRFGDWADETWERVRDRYGCIARRDAGMLNTLYPADMPVVRLRVRRGERDRGWAVVLTRDLGDTPDSTFGPLSIGMVADGLAEPGEALSVVAASTDHLRRSGADLIFSNQSHPAWGAALRAVGFLPAPSQFAFYHSPKVPAAEFYLNRGDCDGPMAF